MLYPSLICSQFPIFFLLARGLELHFFYGSFRNVSPMSPQLLFLSNVMMSLSTMTTAMCNRMMVEN